MPDCCAYRCNTLAKKGYKLHRLPSKLRNAERRRIWLLNIGWEAPDSARLCDKHFTKDQYELNRQDGVKKLKSNAVPTIFRHCPQQLPTIFRHCPQQLPPRKSPAKRNIADNITENTEKLSHQMPESYDEKLSGDFEGTFTCEEELFKNQLKLIKIEIKSEEN